MLLRLFRRAGATGQVFFLRNGRITDKGLAYSGFVGPMTTVAVVPKTAQVIDFSIEAQTKDKQDITITGNLKVALTPDVAVTKFDFTVDTKNGSYVNQWETALQTLVIEQVLAPIHDKAKTVDVAVATQFHKEFETAVKASIAGADNPLSKNGVIVESCSIAQIEADDEEVGMAIGATERQAMLSAADKALHERRLNAAQNERGVRTYEAETQVKLEKERTKLLEQQGLNKKTEATTDAEATKIRLAPLGEVEAGKILGAALLEMAKSGRIGNLSVGPELLAALTNNGARK
jgi:hypothetical protein